MSGKSTTPNLDQYARDVETQLVESRLKNLANRLSALEASAEQTGKAHREDHEYMAARLNGLLSRLGKIENRLNDAQPEPRGPSVEEIAQEVEEAMMRGLSDQVRSQAADVARQWDQNRSQHMKFGLKLEVCVEVADGNANLAPLNRT